MATNEQLAAQLQALTVEVRRLSEDNARLRQEAQGGVQAIPALVEAVASFADRPESSQRARLVDANRRVKVGVRNRVFAMGAEWPMYDQYIVDVYDRV